MVMSGYFSCDPVIRPSLINFKWCDLVLKFFIYHKTNPTIQYVSAATHHATFESTEAESHQSGAMLCYAMLTCYATYRLATGEKK